MTASTTLGTESEAVWSELAGQGSAVVQIRRALDLANAGEDIAHAWLITGPPGSGRSNLALAFAGELLSLGLDPEQRSSTIAQVHARTHADLTVLATDRVIIRVDEVRKLVAASHYAPSVGRFRVIVVEDVDRMSEQTSNVLLKSLEEPPPRTVWVLCAPGEADLLPTIRSRVRTLRLTEPTVDEVAELLVRRDGIEPELARRCAREAQSHVGRARGLAVSDEAREFRRRSIDLALEVTSVSAAMFAAADLVEIAKGASAALSEASDAAERERFLTSLGIAPNGTVPPSQRAQLRQLEEDQKRRATRALRDGLDRVLTDLQSLARDILMTHLGVPVALVNEDWRDRIVAVAQRVRAEDCLAVMDAIGSVRSRVEANVTPILAMEAMAQQLRRFASAH